MTVEDIANQQDDELAQSRAQNQASVLVIADQSAVLAKAHAALLTAVRIAELARQEWDTAPNGMRAGKLLIALAGHLPGYRADIDTIQEAIAAIEGRRTNGCGND